MTRLLLLALILCASPALAQDFALPSPIMTPGAVDSRVTLSDICNGTTKRRRRVPTSRCEAVFQAYGIPDTPKDRYSYECDHLVPLSLSGANSVDNLWPQPNLQAALKDRLEIELQRLVCHGFVSLPEAQREISRDWVESYRKRIGALPSSAALAPAR